MKYSDIYNLCKKIHPIYRSITGKGNKKTLRIFKRINPKLKIIQFKSGKKFLIGRCLKFGLLETHG